MTAIPNFWNTVGAERTPWVDAKSAADASTGSGVGSSSTISANDFLTLLVTEMKNQDPTATTDPNEYINQLVSVNSLQQLIQINQTLRAAESPTSNVAKSRVDERFAHRDAGVDNNHSASAADLVPATEGNLGIPAGSPSALRIAHAFSGRSL